MTTPTGKLKFKALMKFDKAWVAKSFESASSYFDFNCLIFQNKLRRRIASNFH